MERTRPEGGAVDEAFPTPFGMAVTVLKPDSKNGSSPVDPSRLPPADRIIRMGVGCRARPGASGRETPPLNSGDLSRLPEPAGPGSRKHDIE